jgi:hypothetical protein
VLVVGAFAIRFTRRQNLAGDFVNTSPTAVAAGGHLTGPAERCLITTGERRSIVAMDWSTIGCRVERTNEVATNARTDYLDRLATSTVESLGPRFIGGTTKITFEIGIPFRIRFDDIRLNICLFEIGAEIQIRRRHLSEVGCELDIAGLRWSRRIASFRSAGDECEERTDDGYAV